jgi:hypothetical protein
LIAGLRAGFGEVSRGQFQHGVRAQAEGDTPADHVGADLQHFALLAEEHNVDGELHEESVDAFARDDPQAFAGSESCVLEETRAAGGAGVGNIGAIRQGGSTSEVGDAQFRQAFRVARSLARVVGS